MHQGKEGTHPLATAITITIHQSLNQFPCVQEEHSKAEVVHPTPWSCRLSGNIQYLRI